MCVAQMAADTAGGQYSSINTTRCFFFLVDQSFIRGSNMGVVSGLYLEFAHHIWLLFPGLSKQINSVNSLITATAKSGVR